MGFTKPPISVLHAVVNLVRNATLLVLISSGSYAQTSVFRASIPQCQIRGLDNPRGILPVASSIDPAVHCWSRWPHFLFRAGVFLRWPIGLQNVRVVVVFITFFFSVVWNNHIWVGPKKCLMPPLKQSSCSCPITRFKSSNLQEISFVRKTVQL